MKKTLSLVLTLIMAFTMTTMFAAAPASPSLTWDEGFTNTLFTNGGEKEFTVTVGASGQIDIENSEEVIDKDSLVSVTINKGTTVLDYATAQKVLNADGSLKALSFKIKPTNSSTVSPVVAELLLVVKNKVTTGNVTTYNTTNIPMNFTITPSYADPMYTLDTEGNATVTIPAGKEVITEDLIAQLKGRKTTFELGTHSVIVGKVTNLLPINLAASTTPVEGLDKNVLLTLNFKTKGQLQDAAKVSINVDYDFVNTNGQSGYYVYYYNANTGKYTWVANGLSIKDGAITFDLLNNTLGTYVVSKAPITNANTGSSNNNSSSTVTNPETGASTGAGVAMMMLALVAGAGAVVLAKKRG